MEFPFDLNTIFSERVTILDQNLMGGRKSMTRPDHQSQIATVIDELGKASAKSQQLMAPITSALKLQSNCHHLYLLKDGERNGGRGVAVGFVKVGYKKLFLLDQIGAHVEVEPLCILDFYITENLQRHGYGLELYDFMLQHKQVEPMQMAYDRPSPKFLSFLAKHYGLEKSVPQVNNFVVFGGFFLNRSAAQLRKVPPRKPDGEIKPYSLMEREAVREEQRALPWPFVPGAAPPLSPQRVASSQCSRSHSGGSSPSRASPPPPRSPAHAPGACRGLTPQSPVIEGCREKRPSQQGLVARGNLYSRHFDSRSFGQLLERRQSAHQLPGLNPVLTDRETDTLGHTDRKEDWRHHTPAREIKSEADPKAHPRAEDKQLGTVTPMSLPLVWPLGHRAVPQPAKGDRWSWTLGESRHTAQWIKQKQEYRSTRPW